MKTLAMLLLCMTGCSPIAGQAATQYFTGPIVPDPPPARRQVKPPPDDSALKARVDELSKSLGELQQQINPK